MWSFIRFVVSGDLHIDYIGAVLIDLGLYMELVEESILVRSVHHELEVTGPRPEGCQELVMADHSPIKDRLRVQSKFSLEPNLQHSRSVDLGSVSMVCEHLDTSLAGHDVDGPAYQAVGCLPSFQMDSSTNIGFNDDMTSSHVVHVQLPKQIRSTEIEIVGEHGGVIHEIQYMGATLRDVKLNLELREEDIPLVVVNGDLEGVGPD